MQRRLLYFVPAVATLVASYALLGPGRGRPIVGCRVLVADDADGRLRSMRLEVVEKLGAYEEPRAMRDVHVSVDGHELFSGDVPEGGLVDLRVDGPAGPRSIEIGAPSGLLASGRVEAKKNEPPRVGAAVSGGARGPFAIRVELPRGSLSPPFAEELRVVATASDGAPASGVVKLEAEGATLEPTAVTLDERGAGRARVVPMAQTVELTATIEATGREASTWTGELPVAIGSVWLDPRSTRRHLELAARAPHAAAYVSLHDERGRRGGLVVPLSASPDGFYRGGADLEPSDAARLDVVIATDAEERGLSTVAWPVDPRERATLPSRLGRALDGLPSAELREKTRLGRVNRVTAAFLAAAALLEIALLVLESRRTRRDLTTHFAKNAVDEEEIPEGGVVRPVRVDAEKLVVSRASTAVVTGTVALLLLLSAATLAALSFVGR